ncbi:MAG: ORF6N domain-containing protein [Bacilli bacterium]|nr:ORF6N domain-containing protein [Bacilli bacterium]
MKKTISNYLRVIREKTVILDKDLALLLGCDPRAIKDKIRKQLFGFSEDYLFKLTYEEASKLLQTTPLGASKARETPLLGARKQPARGRENDDRYLPYALTFCGVQYLSSKTKNLENKNRYEAIVGAFDSFPKAESKPANLSVKDGGSISGVIYQIRNQFVILDEDLAAYYHSTVIRVNEQVKRNPLKFPDDSSQVNRNSRPRPVAFLPRIRLCYPFDALQAGNRKESI